MHLIPTQLPLLISLLRQDTVVLWSKSSTLDRKFKGSNLAAVRHRFFQQERGKREREKGKKEMESGSRIRSIDLKWMWRHLTILCNINNCCWNVWNIDLRWSKRDGPLWAVHIKKIRNEGSKVLHFLIVKICWTFITFLYMNTSFQFLSIYCNAFIACFIVNVLTSFRVCAACKHIG